MALTLTGSNTSYAPAPEGNHRAICIRVIDLGIQTVSFEGEVSKKPQVMLVWELVDETMDDGRPFTISRTFTASLHKQAGLRKFLNAWRGRDMTEEELAGFELTKLLGVPCLLNVGHKISGDRTYANAISAGKLPKGMAAPESSVNPLQSFDINEGVIPDDLSDFLKKKLMESEQFANGHLTGKNLPDHKPSSYAVGDTAYSQAVKPSDRNGSANGAGHAGVARPQADPNLPPAGATAVDPGDNDCPF